MNLRDGGYLLELDNKYSSYFRVMSTSSFTQVMKDRIKHAIELTVEHPEFNRNKPKLLVIISENSSIILAFPDGAQGHQGNFAFIRYTSFTQYHEIGTLTILTEEFVHYFWDSHDEKYVKSKVCEILPGVRLNESKTHYHFVEL